MKYRTKSVIVEAVQWTGENADEVRKLRPGFTGDAIDAHLIGLWATSEEWIADSYFHERYEPLPESTLDLELIKGLLDNILLAENPNPDWVSIVVDALIAEVRRLRDASL